MSFREIAAVISDTPEEVLDATRENVLAHERVNETVMKSFTVIPMSFGTVFKTRDDIVELLRGAYDAFRDVLDKMQDKVEFGLKVLWDRDVMVRDIENDDEDIRRLKNEISAVPGSTYFARMQYGRQIEGALQTRSEQYVADIFAQLRDVSVAARASCWPGSGRCGSASRAARSRPAPSGSPASRPASWATMRSTRAPTPASPR